MAVTAIAVASRPWLAGDDLIVGIVLFSMWTANGFLFGWSTPRWENRSARMATVAVAAVIANGGLWYCWRFAVSYLESRDSVSYSRAAVLAWLIEIDGWHVFDFITATAVVACVVAAWARRERLLALAVVSSLLFWFVTYWAAFLWTAASSAPPD
jgi:hypothetical protein